MLSNLITGPSLGDGLKIKLKLLLRNYFEAVSGLRERVSVIESTLSSQKDGESYGVTVSRLARASVPNSD